MRVFPGIVSLNAGDGAEVLVDRAKVTFGEMAKIGPGHDLQEVAIKGGGDAVRVWGAGACRVQMIGINAGADSMHELLEGVASDGTPTRVRSEVA